MSEVETATAEPAIVRVPDNPIKLLELKDELEKDNAAITARISRANEQFATNTARLAKIDFRLGEFEAKGGGSMAAAAAGFIAEEEKRIAENQARISAMRAKYGL